MKTSCKFYRTPGTQSRVITTVHDLLGQPSYISLASFLWDKGKRNSPGCDAAKRGVSSGAIMFAYMICIENEIKMKQEARGQEVERRTREREVGGSILTQVAVLYP